jgi:exodeoxyribonuclease VII large subunit
MRASQAPAAPGASDHIYKVSELNSRVRSSLESAYPLIWLQGEVSNFRHFQASGHWYFTLKDNAAQVSAAMFRGLNRQVSFTPEDGAQVLVLAQVSLYEARGSFQVIVRRMEQQGAGALHAAFVLLKEKLESEGLFSADRKKPLPALPRRIGVITSRDGAAVRDILRTLHRRHAGVSVLLIPTRVQGEGAPREIAAAIRMAGSVGGLDALIVGRGGGSMEDLWAFNDEDVARALAACPLPVISAVGHENDFTIADMVADCRAATPTAAATLVVASAEEMKERLHGLQQRLAGSTRVTLLRLRTGPAGNFHHLARRILEQRLQSTVQRTDDLAARLAHAGSKRITGPRQTLALLTVRLSPRSLMKGLVHQRRRLLDIHSRLATAGHRGSERARQRLALAASRLQDLSPLTVLGRGYALAQHGTTGQVLREASQVQAGDELDLRLWRGRVRAQVKRVWPANEDD